MINIQEYMDFCASKENPLERSGFDVLKRDLHASTFDHQADTIRWALRIGKALIAKSFGLGKTHDQIEIAKQVYQKTGKAFLIICPLGVKHQFQHEDGPRLGVKIEYVTSDDDIKLADTPYLITNYERVRDGNISQKALDRLGGVSLDEGAVLRALDSKTWDIFFKAFKNTEYRFVCTATPSPNNYIELLNYAVFLGKIDRGFALTRWFKRDSTKAGNLTLYEHHEEDFWLWVSSWALFLYKPSDLGYDDGDYHLPKMNVYWHRIAVDHRRAWQQVDNKGQRRLILDAAGGVSEATEEKRETLPDRIVKAKEIIAQSGPDTHWLIWHHLEQERAVIQREIPDAVTVWGTMDLDEREKRILDFSHGNIRILATKPTIAGSGCNFQRHCYNVIYLGLDYKFHDFIQSLHRVYRFQQPHDVNVHMIYAESEDGVVRAMQRKWKQHDVLTKKMQHIVKKHGLSDAKLQNMLLKRKLGVIRQEEKGMKLFTAVNNDCVIELNNLPDNHFDMIATSIPFGNHYEYTEQEEDFGHNATNEEFFKQMDFLIPNLLRVLKPGRVAAIHVKDRIQYGHQTSHGFMDIAPFSDDTVFSFRKHGFIYMGRRTLVKDVVAENNQTYRLGWTEMTKDATKMGSGLPEYILSFRKPPTDTVDQRADEPVWKNKKHSYKCQLCGEIHGQFPGVAVAFQNGTEIKCPSCKMDAQFDYVHYENGSTTGQWQIDANQFWRSNGNALISQAMNEIYDYDAHVARLDHLDEKGNLPRQYFVEPPQSHHPEVWTDVQYMHCLNSNQARRRVEQHICPLPIDIVRRMINLYSNPDDLILDPFAGLFTVPVVAMQLGRRGFGIELNPVSYKDGLHYCEETERKALVPTLFDLLERMGEKVK